MLPPRMAATRGVAAEFRESREVALLVEPLESRGLLYFVPPDRMARFTTPCMLSTVLLRCPPALTNSTLWLTLWCVTSGRTAAPTAS